MPTLTVDDRRNGKVVRELNEGDIFVFDGQYYIYVDDYDCYLGVNLQTGKRRSFRDDDKVTVVRATLIIE